jgi:hypothetical protein
MSANVPNTHTHPLVDLPVKNMSQCKLFAFLGQNLECIRRVVAAVDTTNLNVGCLAVDRVNVLRVNVEGDLRVAIDTDVEEVGDSDSLKGVSGSGRCGGRCGGGDASEKGGGDGELHGVCGNGSERGGDKQGFAGSD